MTTAGSPEPLVELPALAGPLDTLWDLIVDLASQLPPDGWVLVGGADGVAGFQGSSPASTDWRRPNRPARQLDRPHLYDR